MLEYMLQSRESSWRFPSTLQTILSLLLINLRTTVPFVTAHLEILHCTHHPVIPKSDLYFTFCSALNALSKRTSK